MGSIMREVVLDPVLCSDRSVVADLWKARGETGWDVGIVLSACSEIDRTALWDACEASDDLQTQQRLQELLSDVMVRSGDNGSWRQSLTLAHSALGVDFIVSRDACLSGPRRLDPDSGQLARELSIKSNDVKRCGLATATAIGPLLHAADEIRMIDRFALRPDQDTGRRFGRFVSDLIAYALKPIFRSSGKVPRLELHSALMPAASSAREQLRSWRSLKKCWSHLEDVKLVLWRDADAWCHDRWILTNHGGVKATAGLDVPSDGRPAVQSLFPLTMSDHATAWHQTNETQARQMFDEAWIDEHR